LKETLGKLEQKYLRTVHQGELHEELRKLYDYELQISTVILIFVKEAVCCKLGMHLGLINKNTA
jgi:hypothetical protein